MNNCFYFSNLHLSIEKELLINVTTMTYVFFMKYNIWDFVHCRYVLPIISIFGSLRILIFLNPDNLFDATGFAGFRPSSSDGNIFYIIFTINWSIYCGRWLLLLFLTSTEPSITKLSEKMRHWVGLSSSQHFFLCRWFLKPHVPYFIGQFKLDHFL